MRVAARNGQLSHTQLLTASSYECESSEFGFAYVRVKSKKKNIGCESSEFGFTYVRVEPKKKNIGCESSEFEFAYVRVTSTLTSAIANCEYLQM